MLSFKKILIPTAAVGASLLLAACGSSASSSSSTAASSAPAASQPATDVSTAPLTIGTTKSSAGTYLTGTSGRALYIWMADSIDKSSCSGACAKAWPPLTASSMPKVTGGASASDISLITRSGGAKQVAYKGRPLYYFAGDPAAGTTHGQGSDSFGAKWWLISPSGGEISGSSGGSSASTSSGGSTTSTSGGGWG